MKKLLFSTVLIAFSMNTYADVFDDLDKETMLIDKYCAGGHGRLSEEIITNKDKRTGKIISEQTVTIIYCTDGSRHVVKKENNDNKLSTETAKIHDGVNQINTAMKNKCTFENSFLIGTCKGSQYFYVEEFSSIKRKRLAAFYRFVKKAGDGTTKISDTCVDFKSKNRKLIRCNDMGIVLELDDTNIIKKHNNGRR